MALLAVTGMAAEARIARRAGLQALVIGGDAPRRLAAVEHAIAEGATTLISFGIAGALAPTLRPGMVVIPSVVVNEQGETFACDTSLPGQSASDKILGATDIVGGAQAKLYLFRSTGAVAVDLESAFVAQAAARARIPFLVLRAIADIADRDLPPAAHVGLAETGRPAVANVLASLWRQPAQLPALISLALETRAALMALGRTARATPWANPPIRRR